jgi:hypothetical protein
LKLVRSHRFRGGSLFCAAALCIASSGIVAALGGPVHAGQELEQRKLPMRFDWVGCEPHCQGLTNQGLTNQGLTNQGLTNQGLTNQGLTKQGSTNQSAMNHGWINAVGIVTADTPREFDAFARGRDLSGATVVLDSSGGSVNDAIALGRRWRKIGLLTTVGSSVAAHGASGDRASVEPSAYCESMCVFLLLSGKVRYVPDGAHVRVHQIWMGDRADDARAASYTAQDMMIVERDIGRLAKFTFDMGGSGDLLSLALNVPPWEELHELSPAELHMTNLITTDVVADVLPEDNGAAAATVALNPKPSQDRFAGDAAVDDKGKTLLPAKPTKTAEAAVPTGGGAPAAPAPQR